MVGLGIEKSEDTTEHVIYCSVPETRYTLVCMGLLQSELVQSLPHTCLTLMLIRCSTTCCCTPVMRRPQEVVDALLPLVPTTTPQVDEMEDVRWFHKDWMTTTLNPAAQPNDQHGGRGTFMIPGPYSLANQLITGWLTAQQRQPSWPGDSVPQVGDSADEVYMHGTICLARVLSGWVLVELAYDVVLHAYTADSITQIKQGLITCLPLVC